MIINPRFQLNQNSNIFTIRKNEYNQILPIVSQIVAPVQNIGFQIADLRLKDSRFSSGEISRTVKQSLIIRLEKGNSKIDLSLFLPKLLMVDERFLCFSFLMYQLLQEENL